MTTSQPTPPPRDEGFVLFHGAGLGRFIWKQVTPHLQGPALALDLPGRNGQPMPAEGMSLAQCAKSIAETLQTWHPSRLVLVGHSVSGPLTLQVAAALGDRVAALVMVGAVVPPPHKAYVDVLPWLGRTLLRTMYRFKPAGLKPPAGVIRKALCSDLDPRTADAVVDNMVAEHGCFFVDRVDASDVSPTSRRVYVVLTHDRSDVTPTLQRTMAQRWGAEVVDLPGGHLPMLSQPQRLADVLNGVLTGLDSQRITKRPGRCVLFVGR